MTRNCDSEESYLTRVEEICQRKGYEFVGFDGPFRGNKTRVSLMCKRDNFRWLVSMTNFLGGSGCKQCANDRLSTLKRKEDKDCVADFLSSGKFLEGTQFSRGHQERLWKYSCPKCSFDDFVENNLCTGVFYGTTGRFNIGSLSCRCAKNYRWSEAQWVHRIKSFIEQNNLDLKYNGWTTHYKGSVTKVNLECGVHGPFDIRVRSFLEGGSCPMCAVSGFKSSLDAVVYVIRVAGDSEFTGYGISNKFKNRLLSHKRNIKKSGCFIEDIEIFNMEGRLALQVENALKSSFEVHPQNIDGFRKETTKYYLFDAVLRFIDELLGKIKRKQK